jgi:hypothetical protein
VYGNDFGWGWPLAVWTGAGNKVDGNRYCRHSYFTTEINTKCHIAFLLPQEEDRYEIKEEKGK